MREFITYYFFDIVAAVIILVTIGIGFRAGKDTSEIKNSR